MPAETDAQAVERIAAELRELVERVADLPAARTARFAADHAATLLRRLRQMEAMDEAARAAP